MSTTSAQTSQRREEDSQALYPDFADEVEGFFRIHCGSNTQHTLSDYTGNTSRLNKVQKLIHGSIDTRPELSTYAPLAKALTLISLDVCQGDKAIAFAPNANNSLRVMDGAKDKLDIVGFFVKSKEAELFINGKNYSIKVPFTYKIIVGIECKVQGKPVMPGQRYCFAIARQMHESPLQYGFVISIKQFRLLSISLDNNGFWDEVKWETRSVGPILKLYDPIRLIWEEASTRDERVPVSEYLITIDNGRKRPITMHSAILGRRLYYLIPIFSGRDNGRKSFVALAFAADNPADRLVLKYSWHSDNSHSRERYFLENLKDAPGVVLIDEALSSDSIQYDEESGRHQNLIALNTIGRSVSSAESVLEFLETMYDLLEVLQHHAHELNILHRDISWGNVLIPVNTTTQTPKKGANWDKYQFISDYDDDVGDMTGDDIPQESRPRRVRVALIDFDNARDLTTETDNLQNATGTPMFMANDVLAPRPFITTITQFSKPILTRIYTALAGSDKKYWMTDNEAKWDTFYNGLHQIDYEYEEDAELNFRHSAMHDAESVFYLCLLFFSRVMREEEEISDAELCMREIERGEAFEEMANKTAGNGNSEPFPRNLPLSGFDAGFRDMLYAIYQYLKIPWYNVSNTGHGEPFEFHLHDFMQRLILKEIRRLRVSSNIPLVPLALYPLARKSNVARNYFSLLLSTSGL